MPAMMTSPDPESLLAMHVSLAQPCGNGSAALWTARLLHPCPCALICQTPRVSLHMGSYGINPEP